MTFLVRTISRSAEGREIIRSREVPGFRLTIGRDPNSDIHLTDLAVALQHAVVQLTSPSRLSVSAEEGLGIELNGRKVSSGAIEIAGGGDLRIGSHVLRFMPGVPGAEQIQLDVEKVGESAEDVLDITDVNRFSLSSVLPGKRMMAYSFIAVVLALFLAWPLWVYQNRTADRPAGAFAADSMWSSGSLSNVHHSLENNCSACHVRAFQPVQDNACKTCHQAIHDHGDTDRPAQESAERMLRSRPNLTGFARFQLAVASAFGQTAGRCVDCHTEHEGPQEMPRTAQAFCTDCHTDLNARLPDTRIGNAGDFGTAHPAFRPTILANWNGEQPVWGRVSLEQNPSENSNLRFPHALHLNATGGVTQNMRRLATQPGSQYAGREQLGCADCHTVTPDGVSFQPVRMQEACADCHALTFDEADGVRRTLRHGAPEQVVADLREYYRGRSPARPAELGDASRRRPGDLGQVRAALQYARAQSAFGSTATDRIAGVFREGGACYDCHVIDQLGPLSFRVRPVAFPTRYFQHGYFDHRAHQNVTLEGRTMTGTEACLTCHVATRSNSAQNLLIPGLQSCQRCHGGEDSNTAVPSSCAMCHDYHFDDGTPAMLLRQRPRGQTWEAVRFPIPRNLGGNPTTQRAPMPWWQGGRAAGAAGAVR